MVVVVVVVVAVVVFDHLSFKSWLKPSFNFRVQRQAAIDSLERKETKETTLVNRARKPVTLVTIFIEQ